MKAEFPLTKTILGVSNVSFGLPPPGREVLNSVFLYHATQAGLDAAIVNTERLARYAEIPDEERRLAEALIDLELGDEAAGEAAVAAFTAHFRERSGQTRRAPAPSRADAAARRAPGARHRRGQQGSGSRPTSQHGARRSALAATRSRSSTVR